MRPESRKFLYDIHTACQALQEFLKGKTLDEYNSDDFLRSAVERKLMIIGEALSQGFHKDPSLEQHIPQTRKIVDFRNILVHGYYAIQNETVWGILQKDIPILMQQVQTLLKC
jgi:uncharacterized protein with HEPN domain